MVITRLEELEQTKVKVYIDDTFAFMLYQKDIEHYNIREGSEITEYCVKEIIEDTVYRRAKQKALAILKFMDRTESELSQKLSDAGYTQNIIERTIDYVTEYGYLNDKRFTASYIRSRIKNKSKLAIKTELLQKGVSKDILAECFTELYEAEDNEDDAELIAIKKAVMKKTNSPETLDPAAKQKLMAALYRKGFEISKIKQVLS